MITFPSVVGYILGLLILFVVARIFMRPVAFILRLIMSSILGGVILCLINLAHPVFHLYIGINPVTSLVTGLFGIPGICLLLLLQIIF